MKKITSSEWELYKFIQILQMDCGETLCLGAFLLIFSIWVCIWVILVEFDPLLDIS